MMTIKQRPLALPEAPLTEALDKITQTTPISRFLMQLRKAAALSQEQVARGIGMDKDKYSLYEYGHGSQTRPTSLDRSKAKKLAKLYGYDEVAFCRSVGVPLPMSLEDMKRKREERLAKQNSQPVQAVGPFPWPDLPLSHQVDELAPKWSSPASRWLRLARESRGLHLKACSLAIGPSGNPCVFRNFEMSHKPETKHVRRLTESQARAIAQFWKVDEERFLWVLGLPSTWKPTVNLALLYPVYQLADGVALADQATEAVAHLDTVAATGTSVTTNPVSDPIKEAFGMPTVSADGLKGLSGVHVETETQPVEAKVQPVNIKPQQVDLKAPGTAEEALDHPPKVVTPVEDSGSFTSSEVWRTTKQAVDFLFRRTEKPWTDAKLHKLAVQQGWMWKIKPNDHEYQVDAWHVSRGSVYRGRPGGTTVLTTVNIYNERALLKIIENLDTWWPTVAGKSK